MTSRRAATLFVLVLALQPLGALAYETDSHAMMCCIALGATTRNDLKCEVPDDGRMGRLLDALEYENVQNAAQLVAKGAIAEDNTTASLLLSPTAPLVEAVRVMAHFHEVIENKGLEYVVDIGLVSFEIKGPSSAYWQQGQTDPHGISSASNDFTWKTARDNLYFALTFSKRLDRREGFYLDSQLGLFHTVGHLLHHYQDAASPPHTRGDMHLNVPIRSALWGLDVAPPDPSLYERRIRSKNVFLVMRDRNFDIPPVLDLGLDPPALPNTPPFAPVSNFQDAENYTATSDCTFLPPPGNFGIGEFTASHFYSKDTRPFLGFNPSQPCPRLDDLTEGEDRYNYQVGPVLIAPILKKGLLASTMLDGEVLDEYAKHLVPLAIAHSASVFDYFFRGIVDPNGTPALEVERLIDGTVQITNRSSEDLSEGTLEFHYDNAKNDQRKKHFELDIDLPVGVPQIVDVRLDEIPENEFPEDGQSFVFVYEGKMGNEENAIAARTCTCGPDVPDAQVCDQLCTPINTTRVAFIDLPSLPGCNIGGSPIGNLVTGENCVDALAPPGLVPPLLTAPICSIDAGFCMQQLLSFNPVCFPTPPETGFMFGINTDEVWVLRGSCAEFPVGTCVNISIPTTPFLDFYGFSDMNFLPCLCQATDPPLCDLCCN